MLRKTLLIIALLVIICSSLVYAQKEKTKKSKRKKRKTNQRRCWWSFKLRINRQSAKPPRIGQPSQENGSLYSDNAPNTGFLTDFKARSVGDLVFVDVVETATATVDVRCGPQPGLRDGRRIDRTRRRNPDCRRGNGWSGYRRTRKP